MNSYNNNTKRQVLSLYSRIIRLSKSWTAKEPKNTCIEREYILTEARNEFRKNILETDQLKIKQLLDEGNKRVGIALHYGIPYDRPEYLPPSTSYAPHGIMSLPPLFQINLEQTLIDRIRPFLRSFFSDINIREEIIENFVLAVKEYKELHLDEIIFNSPAKAVFPGRKNKLKNLCKLAIKKFEQLQMDPSDILYQNICLSMECEQEYFFSIFPLNFKQFSSPTNEQINYLVICQNIQNISKGTTGLCCWQASFALADFLFLSFSTNLLAYLSNAKYILELGAGCGLVGILLAKQFYLNKNKEIKLILSDSDNFVLELLNKNIKLNFGNENIEDNLIIESKYLDWTNFIPNDLPPADVIVASGPEELFKQ
uniref:Complex 1 LYR protein domain-containing protein n=1 Tax=Meloidogyne javanica TaxID=6303 RepID=A0A915N0E7_MELJA